MKGDVIFFGYNNEGLCVLKLLSNDLNGPLIKDTPKNSTIYCTEVCKNVLKQNNSRNNYGWIIILMNEIVICDIKNVNSDAFFCRNRSKKTDFILDKNKIIKI
ncbi:hypothetical protein V2605_03395, partial [Tenacibaculum maritimum]